MKDLIRNTFLCLLVLSGVACSDSSDISGPKKFDLNDMTGVYRTDSALTNISSVTSLEVFNGRSELDLSVVVLRNGLSPQEYTYFNGLNEVQWADSKLGREIELTELNESFSSKAKLEDGINYIDVCGALISLNSRTMDFRYCLSFEREEGSLLAEGVLSLEVYEFGTLVNLIETDYRVFIKDRWFVDYYGEWSGQVVYSNSNSYGLRLETGDSLNVTFQPVAETHYILRPLDTNQTIRLNGENFILFPETREMTELEDNANPYINFVYISDYDGSRSIVFRSFVHTSGHIEGSVELKLSNGNTVILGTYRLDKI
jgi:hypothetical protein